MDKLINIIHDSGMSDRPGYYSGRGATTSDLNHKILTKIHEGIKKVYGEDAGKNFVTMVADIRVLSATTFLVELYNLYNADWCYKPKKKHASGIQVDKDENGNHNMMQGFASIFSALSNNRDETRMIRDQFLIQNGVKPKSDPNSQYITKNGRKVYVERNAWGDTYYRY